MNKNDIFQKLRANREELVRLGVRRIGLFGSHVRGESNAASDLDFLVEFSHGSKSYDNFIDLCFFLEQTFGRGIDLLTPESLSPHLRPQIETEVEFENLQ